MTDLARYYDESYPPSVWGGGTVPATSAVAGVPGHWLPEGSNPPATVADLMGGIPNEVTASPATPWTGGQFVQTRTAGAAGRATWTGAGWVGGVAPAVTADEVAGWTIDEVKAFVVAHPDFLAEITELEKHGRARAGLLHWLQTLLDEEDEAEDEDPDDDESTEDDDE